MNQISLQKLEKETLDFPERANLIVVKDNESLLVANGFLRAIKGMRKEVDDTFRPIIERAHQAHKEALIQKKKYENPLIEAEKIIKYQIAPYLAEQERIRKEAEERARREEEKRQRLEEEKLQKALEAENAGKNEEAERIISEEIPEIKPFIPPPTPPKLQGTGLRKIWKWRIADIKQIPKEFLVVDSAKITNLVKTTKGEIRIPGIEVYSEDSVSVRI